MRTTCLPRTLLKRKTNQRLLRDDVFRADDFLAVARPPRAPAARTDIAPRPLVVRDEDELRVDDFFAVARPPFAPAFFFCAVVPARPPFAPAAFTDIVPRPLVVRADELRVEVFLAVARPPLAPAFFFAAVLAFISFVLLLACSCDGAEVTRTDSGRRAM